MASSENTEYKLVVVGGKGAGKSALIRQFLYQDHSKYDPTIEDSYRKECFIDGRAVVLDILDTAGQEEYSAMRDQYMRVGEGFLLVYTIMDRFSFEEIEKYYGEILRIKDMPNFPMILVANEPLLEEEGERGKRVVSTTEGEAMALRLKIKYVETSIDRDYNHNVERAFHDLVRLVRRERHKNVPAEKYLEIAMKDGYIPHKDDLFLIHGPGGVGKSSLISMFLGKQRDLIRVSTAVAEESIHICPVRDVSNKMFTDKWELVDIDRQARMIAHTSHHLLTSEGVQKLGSPEQNRASEEEKQAFLASPSIAVPVQRRHRLAKLTSKFLSGISKVVKKLQKEAETSLTTMLEDDPDNIANLFARFKEGLHDIMRNSVELSDQILYYSIRLLDSGGQPQFHEVVSILLPVITAIISVFKLSECLNIHGEVVFYDDGKKVSDPYKSYLTNEQVIRHDLLAIQSKASHSGMEEVPSLAFVGTHLDQQDACPEETPDQKDEQLHSMITEVLPEKLQKCVISNSESLQHVTFRVNARTPTNKDYETTRQLKDALMSKSRVKPRNLPLKWCGFELALRKLMEELNRQILSMKECEFIAFQLGFDFPSLKACLNYLRQLHIITFYDILPNTIFGSCQVVLDKITELIVYSLELKKGIRPLSGTERQFHQHGILSLEILQSKACSKHYSRGYFSPEDLLKILKSLLIVTEVGPGEYLMPCVLEVSNVYPWQSPPKGSIRSSFVLHFSKKSPMLGIYCCTISYLMTVVGWELLKEKGEVVQIARNSVTFKMPRGLPGKITFLDPISSYLEVVVDLPAVIVQQPKTTLFLEIRDTFFKAIKNAMETLHYEVKTPELSFLCPEQSSKCSILPHLATVDESHSFLTCSVKPSEVFQCLSPYQKIWLCGSEDGFHENVMLETKTLAAPPLSISGEKPTFEELLKIHLPSRVGPNIKVFGTYILQDSYSDKMANITEYCHHNPEKIAMEVLSQWLMGKGVEVSWENLISTLRKSNLLFLADQIQMALDNL